MKNSLPCNTVIRISLFSLTVGLLLLTTPLQSANRVMIKAIATESFLKERALNPQKKIQTYQFMEGSYFGGNSRNKGMEKISFMDVVTDMAVHLQKQGFYPISEKGQGDLLIVVHYGVTDEEESYEDLMGITSLSDLGFTAEVANAEAGTALDPGTLNALGNFAANLNSSQALAEHNDKGSYFKAKLLGMEEAYSTRGSQREKDELLTLLKEERYFVVLMAFDYESVRKGKPRLAWSTRYSIRAAGQNFETAIASMNLVASDYFGKNLPKLTRKRADDDSSVEIGEIEVLGQETPE